MSVYLSIFLPVVLQQAQANYLSKYLNIFLSRYIFVFLSIYLLTWLVYIWHNPTIYHYKYIVVYLSRYLCLSIYISLSTYIFLSIYLPVGGHPAQANYLSKYLSICLMSMYLSSCLLFYNRHKLSI